MRSIDLIHQIANAVVQSFKLPFCHFSVVNEDLLLDLIEELETTLPEALAHAQEVLAQQGRLIAEARQEAEDIINNAKLQARSLVNESEVLKHALAEAERLRQDAAAEVLRTQSGADRYAEEVLSELESKVARALATVQNGRQQLSLS